MMSKLWILRGDLEAAGWGTLRSDYEDEKIEIIHLDPKVWAIVDADSPPEGYEGLQASEPENGMYVDPNGSPLYLFDGAVVPTADELVERFGEQATTLLETTGDAVRVLERLGRVF